MTIDDVVSAFMEILDGMTAQDLIACTGLHPERVREIFDIYRFCDERKGVYDEDDKNIPL